jgi:putative heme-binding domain-containing protein
VDIPDHGAACQVFRLSPFEPWRVERTRRRKNDPAMRSRLPATELVPGGFVTSGCSPIVYTADNWPEQFRGNTLICDPANNLIHRDRLEVNGSIFKAVRTEQGREFLASTDNWFRPVCQVIGPDGALYVGDFYREAIETPLSLPEDIRKMVNVETCGRGRIWRIARQGSKPGRFKKLNDAGLVAELASPNPWRRLTAQRLLVERDSRTAAPAIEELFRSTAAPQGRAHALWTLQGLQALPPELIGAGLADSSPGVRIQSLKLAEGRASTDSTLRSKMIALAADPDSMVRFQAALSLGAAPGDEAAAALARLLSSDVADEWAVTAALSSCGGREPAVLGRLGQLAGANATNGRKLAGASRRVAALIASSGKDADLAGALRQLARGGEAGRDVRNAILEGVMEGLARSGKSMDAWWQRPPADLAPGVEAMKQIMVRAGKDALDSRLTIDQRESALRLLRSGPFDLIRDPLAGLLQPAEPLPLQLAAIRALSSRKEKKAAELLMHAWASAGPAARREILEAQFGRKDRLAALLENLESGSIQALDLDPARREQLRNHPDAGIRARAVKVLRSAPSLDRRKVLEDYRPALKLAANAGKGKQVFKRVCSTCHRLEGTGNEVGPDLLSALRSKTPETLLEDLLDPSKEVDPRFLNYLVTLRDGRTLTGMIATETANSVTLRRAEKAEDTVLRNQIEEVAATRKSLMPENLEAQLSRQDLADVIGYLLQAAGTR